MTDILALSRIPNDRDKVLQWEMLTRFVFSCLVDADSLDTERHSSGKKSDARRTTPLNEVLDEWLQKLQQTQDEFRTNPSGNENVNNVRREVYGACLQAATRPPGLFTLTVPTGGGKTLSSLAFAWNTPPHVVTRIRRSAPASSTPPHIPAL